MNRVIDLFKSGRANSDQWEEMAQALVIVSELKCMLPESSSLLWAIDEAVEFDENEEEFEEMEMNH